MIEDVNIELAPTSKIRQISLTSEGQVEPIRLRPDDDGRFDLIDGRQRLVDLIDLGETEVLALVESASDIELHTKALILNSGVGNPMDECLHILALTESGFTQVSIAEKCSWSQAKVSQRLKLLELIPEFRQKLSGGEINVTTAMTLTKLSEDGQKDLLEEKKVSTKRATEALRAQQSGLLELFSVETPKIDIKPGLFLTAEQIEDAEVGGGVLVYWNGETLLVSVSVVAKESSK